jgi:chromosome segregation protein
VAFEEARQRKSAIELKLVELRSDIKHLEETCQRELQRPIQLILEGQPSEITAEQLEDAETNYGALKEKLDNLGPVNVLALEEYKEAKQRHDFLETQQDDLLTSISDTQKAIAEIDVVSRRKFQEAFDAINNHFRGVFQTLFGGGVAEMRLIEDENAAESGIDIIASPPGKRLQNIALLSGGEKSLTAVALLMATFRYRPSPFCVMDEVDAPLDESNLVRFSRLISQMSETTQFIIITHSKTTMETAQTLYGVTMQQPGVSRLVSVRMPAQQNGPARREPVLSMS